MTNEDLKKVDELIDVVKELVRVEKQRNEILAKAYIYGWDSNVVSKEREKIAFTENLLRPKWGKNNYES